MNESRSASPGRARTSAFFWTVVAVGVLIRLTLAPLPGYDADVVAFERWGLAIAHHGPSIVFSDPALRADIDYLPGYLLFFGGLGTIDARFFGDHTGGLAYRMLSKAPSMLADFLLAFAVYGIALRCLPASRARLAGALVILAPPTWIVSSLWGQVDSLPAALLAIAVLYALDDRIVATWLVFTGALLLKPQGLPLIPIFLAWQVRRSDDVGRLAGALGLSAAGAAAMAYLVTLPFSGSAAPTSVFGLLAAQIKYGIGRTTYASVSAFNLYTIFGLPYRDASSVGGISWHLLGTLAGSAIILSAALVVWRNARTEERSARRTLVVAAAVALATPFFLATRMRERYIFAALALGCVPALADPRFAVAFGVIAVVFVANLAAVMLSFTTGAHHPSFLIVVHVLSALNVAAYAFILWTFWRSRRAADFPEPGNRRKPVRDAVEAG